MKLAFKRRFGFGFKEREIEIILNISTLEATCKALEIALWQITDFMEKDNFDFLSELLYQGYLTACKERFRRPKYDKIKAIIWQEHMSHKAQKEFADMMTELFGTISKTINGGKKKVKREILK